MEIVIIGTGNTATVLGKKLKAAGHRIVQVFGRDAAAASELAYALQTESTNYWSVVERNADLYIVAVNDIAIAEVVGELNLGSKTVVHTAASVGKEILKTATEHFGVLYPLQTLKKESDHLPEIPVIIDASDPETLEQLEQLAFSITGQVHQAQEAERVKLHIAAVFCNNFVNHIYALMEEYCRKENLDFNLLIPLIQETALRLNEISPAEAQTGPASRGDNATIENHLKLLESYPELQQMYQLFTKSIKQLH